MHLILHDEANTKSLTDMLFSKRNNKSKKETKNLNEKIKTTTDNHLHIENIFSCFILFISKLIQHYFISMT